MTPESPAGPRDRGTRALVLTAAVASALGAACVGLGALVSGSAGAWGALVGAALVVVVLGFGTVTVNLVAGLLPAASLMVALLTYLLQVVAMAVAFAAISGSGVLDETVSRGWLGGTVIAGTAAWLAAQLTLATTRRIPVYDLPATPAPGAPVHASEAVER